MANATSNLRTILVKVTITINIITVTTNLIHLITEPFFFLLPTLSFSLLRSGMYSRPLYSGQCEGSRIGSNLDSHVFNTILLEYNGDMYADERWDTPLTWHASIIWEHGTCNNCGTQHVQVALVVDGHYFHFDLQLLGNKMSFTPCSIHILLISNKCNKFWMSCGCRRLYTENQEKWAKTQADRPSPGRPAWHLN